VTWVAIRLQGRIFNGPQTIEKFYSGASDLASENKSLVSNN